MLTPEESLETNRLIEEIRGEFPRVGADARGIKRVFFQNAGGSLVLQRAVEAEMKSRLDYAPGAGDPSWESKTNLEIIHEGRQAVADLLNAEDENCIISGEN